MPKFLIRAGADIWWDCKVEAKDKAEVYRMLENGDLDPDCDENSIAKGPLISNYQMGNIEEVEE